MLRSKLKKLQDRVDTARRVAAEIADRAGAPSQLSALLRPGDAAPSTEDSGQPRWSPSEPGPASPAAEPAATPRSDSTPAAPADLETAAPDSETTGDSVHIAATSEQAERRDQVQQLLDDLINPAVASHGGHIALVDVEQDKVLVEMGGGCQGCGAAVLTLKAGVERMLKEELPWLTEVVDKTDHSLGTNPFYGMEK